MFNLFYLVVLVALFAAFLLSADRHADELNPPVTPVTLTFGLLVTAFVIASVVPNISLSIRRLHDQGKTGWLYLFTLIPFVGSIILLAMMCIKGREGANKYGDDPKSEIGMKIP